MLRIEKLLKDKKTHFMVTPYRTLDIYLPSASIHEDSMTPEGIIDYLLSGVEEPNCEVINDD